MANLTPKNNFILYTDYFEQIQMLTIEQRGVLLTALMCYQLGDDLPEMDSLTMMCYSFISSDVRRNNRKYEEIAEKRRAAGSKGGKVAQANRANQAKASDKVNVKDNVKVNVNGSGSGSGNDNVLASKQTTTTTTCPTLEQIKAWCAANCIQTNVEKFYAYNEARGWTLNGKPADWQKLLQLWVANDSNHNSGIPQEESAYDFDEIERTLVNQ